MEKVIDLMKRRIIYVFLIVMVIFFTLMNDNFFTGRNLLNVARQVSIYGIASVGMTYVILLGGIDLSIGSIISLVNIVAAYIMVEMGLSPIIAIIASLIMSALIGFANGFIIAQFGMPEIIVTFASQTIFAGLAYIISGGTPISRFPESFLVIGQGYIGPIPIPVIIMAVIFLIGWFISEKTYIGRYMYAIGGNEEAATLSGINVKRMKYLVYSLSGFFAGIAGIVMLARANTGQPGAGVGYEFDVITCVVLGGVSTSGGSGRMSNVIAGVLIIGVLSNGMVLLNISSYMQMVVKGVILLIAVGVDSVQKNRKNVAKRQGPEPIKVENKDQ